jgi:hypothetical protein
MSNIVSIAELTPDTHPNPEHVTEGDYPLLWDMELPPNVDAERITVDMRRLGHIHAVGGMAASFVEGYEDAGSKEISVGSCTDPFDCYFDSISLKNATFGRPAVTHQMNELTLAARTEQRFQAADTSKEEVWAELYDEAIRSSMVQAARQSLMGRKERVPYLLNFSSYALTGVGIIGLIGGLAGVIPGGSAVFELGAYTAAQAGPQMIRKNRTKGKETLPRRVSIVPMNRQPDRYALTWALCRKSDLVRVAA